MIYRSQSMNVYHITYMSFDTEWKLVGNLLVNWITFLNLHIKINEAQHLQWINTSFILCQQGLDWLMITWTSQSWNVEFPIIDKLPQEPSLLVLLSDWGLSAFGFDVQASAPKTQGTFVACSTLGFSYWNRAFDRWPLSLLSSS